MHMLLLIVLVQMHSIKRHFMCVEKNATEDEVNEEDQVNEAENMADEETR